MREAQTLPETVQSPLPSVIVSECSPWWAPQRAQHLDRDGDVDEDPGTQGDRIAGSSWLYRPPPRGRPGAHQEYRRDLRREPELRSSLRPVPGRERDLERDAETYLQRDHDGSVLPYLRVWNTKGERIPTIHSCPTRRSGRRAPVGKLPTDVLLSPITPIITTVSRSTAAGTTCSPRCRPSAATSWAISTAQDADVGLGETIHARRQLLHGRLRRLLPEPPISRLCLRTAARGCAGGHAGLARGGRQAEKKKPDSPSARDGAVRTYIRAASAVR